MLIVLAAVARAQLQLPPVPGWTEPSVSSRGLVLDSWAHPIVMPRGQPHRRLPAELEDQVQLMVAFERGVALSGDFGLAFLPWDKLDGPATMADGAAIFAQQEGAESEEEGGAGLWVQMLTARGDVVLALDIRNHVWTLDAAGSWSRSAQPLPDSASNLGFAAGRWVLRSLREVSELSDGVPYTYQEVHYFWSEDGATWHEAELPADYDRRSESFATLLGDGELWVMDLGFGELLVSKDGKRWSRESAPLVDAGSRVLMAVARGRLHALEDVKLNGTSGALRHHVRELDGTWRVEVLRPDMECRYLVEANGELLVLGARDPEEVPNLMPLQRFLEPRERLALPECASLRFSLPTPDPMTLGVLRD
ncbi:MAG: hypothetical protein ACKO4Q_04565, partial [Planctomycetota bacterium]